MSLWSFLTGKKSPGKVADASAIRERMIYATAEALETLPLFWAQFQNAADSGSFLLKIALPTPDDDREYIWVDWIEFDGSQYQGSLTNEPVQLPGRRARDRVTFTEADITDWAYPSSAGYRGHFTTRAMLPILDRQTAIEVQKTLAPTPTETTA